jgi:broad specificity phosphatase PhoE
MKITNVLTWFAAAGCALALQVSANSIYLVRHAEKQDDSKDPMLSACGEARAQALAAYFNKVPLAAVYATPYQRTQQTAAAVASSKKLPVNHYDPGKPEQLVQQLNLSGGPVLVVGHSNTVPELVKLFSGIEVAPLTEQQYNVLYQVQLGEQRSVTISKQSFQCQQVSNI